MNEVDYSRIKKALRWYKDNIGGQYIPVIESGNSLRMKFSKLEAAMQREQINNKPPQIIEDGQRWLLQPDGLYKNNKGEVLTV